MRAITAHRAWPLHVDDWRSEGWWWCGSGGAVETFMLWNKCRPSRITTGIVENEIESDHAGGGRMASIGVETVSTPARLKAACASFDASRSRCQETRTQACKRASHHSINQEEERRARGRTTQGQPASPSFEPARGWPMQRCSKQASMRLKRPNKWKQGIKRTHHTTNKHGSLVHLLQDHQG